MTYLTLIQDPFISKVSMIVHDNLSNELFGVEQMAEKAGLSRGHLHRKIKSLTGHSPNHFLSLIRLYYGQELLTDNNLSVAEVADMVGFNSNTYFIKCFSDHFGVPPGKFKLLGNEEVLLQTVPDFINAFKHIISEYEGKKTNKKTLNNLPDPPTRFFGRKSEIDEVINLLSNNKIVSVIGAGGSGKSRFALEVGRAINLLFPDGVWLISLAPITQPKLVLHVFGEIFNMIEQDPDEILKTLASRISHKKMLLIVDNCEHLIDECARILTHLTHFTLKPKFLITSREVLKISGESVYTLPTLPIPQGVDPSDLTGLTENISIQLFLDRARLVRPDFSWNKENSGPVVEICQKLDGIPLAIELAASRTRFISPAQIAEHLGHELKVLSTDLRTSLPRHKTLEATMDWSVSLLTEEEKQLFFRLCLFNTVFGAEAIEEVCNFGALKNANFNEIIASLVDKSILVMVEFADRTRYKLLEPTKQYAYSKLDNEDLVILKDRYIDYHISYARQAHNERIFNEAAHLPKLVAEHPNFIRALEMAREQPQKFVMLAGYLGWYWWEHSELLIGKEHLAEAMKLYQVEDKHLARCLFYYGIMETWYAGNNPEPEKGLEKTVRAMDIFNDINDEIYLANMYPQYGFIHLACRKHERGAEILNEGLKLRTTKESPVLQLYYKMFLSWYHIVREEPEKAAPVINEAYKNIHLSRSSWYTTVCKHIYADIPLFCGDYKEGERRYLAAILHAHKASIFLQVAVEMTGLAMSLAGQGRHKKALRLTGAALEKFEEMNAKLMRLDFWDNGFNKTVGKSMQVVEESEVHLLMAEGRSMGFEEAIEYASNVEED